MIHRMSKTGQNCQTQALSGSKEVHCRASPNTASLRDIHTVVKV